MLLFIKPAEHINAEQNKVGFMFPIINWVLPEEFGEVLEFKCLIFIFGLSSAVWRETKL